MILSKEMKELYEQMKESGYDMFDINNPFYQDICTPFDSPNGTDILLEDRKNFIYNNDETQCQTNCKLSYYSMESEYLNCSCSITEDYNDGNEKVEKFTAKKIYESFYEVLKYSNYDIIKCFKIIFNINVISINYGSIIVIIFFYCYLTCLIIFIIRRVNPLQKKFINDFNKIIERNKIDFKNNIYDLLNPPKKMKPSHQLVLRADIERRNQLIYQKKYGLKNTNSIEDKIHIYHNWDSRRKIINNSPKNKLIF